MKVTIDKSKCIGCGACQAVCPAVFEIKEGKAIVKGKIEGKKKEKEVKEAADSCPVQAIKIS